MNRMEDKKQTQKADKKKQTKSRQKKQTQKADKKQTQKADKKQTQKADKKSFFLQGVGYLLFTWILKKLKYFSFHKCNVLTI
jgi:hypothetical protein